MSKLIRLQIVDDHPLVRNGIAALLKEEAHIEIIHLAGNGQEALEKAKAEPPDIVLMDIDMPVMNGLEAASKFHELLPEVKVLVLTMHDAPEYILRVMDVGAAGYVLKDVDSDVLLRHIKAIHDGIFAFPPIRKNTQKTLSDNVDDTCQLTPREREVVVLLAEGKPNKLIARQFGISERTIETHRDNIKRKIGNLSPRMLMEYIRIHGLDSAQ